ncbi:MAG: hypothetical protein AAGJ97_14350 [Planctomycetota bacterium]
MTSGPERRLTDRIIKSLDAMRRNGDPIYWVKLAGHGRQRSGLPDLHVTVDGISLWVEIKTEAGTVSAPQEIELGRWAAAGALSFVARSAEDVERAVWSVLTRPFREESRARFKPEER